MNEIDVFAFQHAIRETHGSRSQFIERVSVVETFEGGTVWEGEVLVLHTGPVNSPVAAIRASILAEESDG